MTGSLIQIGPQRWRYVPPPPTELELRAQLARYRAFTAGVTGCDPVPDTGAGEDRAYQFGCDLRTVLQGLPDA